jgi:branched-chain amino acid transport system substrate-binding protein
LLPRRWTAATLCAVVCAAALSLVAGCQSFETKPPVQPPPPVRVVPAPMPPPQPLTAEPLAAPEHLAPGRPAYNAQQAAALRPGPAAPPPDPGTVRVGLLVPLSGADARIGTAMLRASLLALFETGGSNLQLLPYDTAGRSDQAVRSAKLALADGCSLFLGPLLAADVQAAAPLAAERSVPVIAFSSDRRVAGNNVFLLGMRPGAQVDRVLRYAAERNRRKLAILAPDDAYGAAVVQAAKATAADAQVTLVAIETYAPSTTDFAEIVRRLPGAGPDAVARAPSSSPPVAAPPAGGIGAALAMPPDAPPASSLPFDTLLIADGGARLKAIATQLGPNGITAPQVQILGTGLWDEPDLGAQSALVGAWYAAPDPTFRHGFEADYNAAFGSQPPRLATLAYDATAMAAVLAPEVGALGVFDDRLLTDPSGFLGRDGLFRLLPDGLADRRLAVLQVEPRDVSVVSVPATSFAGS